MKELIKHCIKLLYDDNFREDIYQLRNVVYKNFKNVYPKPPINFFRSINNFDGLVEADDLYDWLTNDQEFIDYYNENQKMKLSKIKRGRKKKKLSYEDKYFVGYYGYCLEYKTNLINIDSIKIISNNNASEFLKNFSSWYYKAKDRHITQSFLNYYFDFETHSSKNDYSYLIRKPVSAKFLLKSEKGEPTLYSEIIKKWNYEGYTSLDFLYDKTIHKHPMDSFIKACCVFKLETIHPKFVLPPISKQIIFIDGFLKELELTKFKFELLLKELKKPNSTKQDVLNKLYSDEIKNKFDDLSEVYNDLPLILLPGYLPSEQEWSKLRKELKDRQIAIDDTSENINGKFMLYLEKKEEIITYEELAERHYKEPEWYNRYEGKKDDEGLDISDYEIIHKLHGTFKTSIGNLIKEYSLTKPKRGKRKK